MNCVLNNEQRMYIIKVRTNNDLIVSVRLRPGFNSVSDKHLELLNNSKIFKGLQDRGVMITQAPKDDVKEASVKEEKAAKAKKAKK